MTAFIDRLATRWLWIDQGQLRKLNRPAPFYESLLRPQPDAKTVVKLSDTISKPRADSVEPSMDPDAILARLDILEGLLKADRARKPKFQKPAKQQQWRAAIDQFWQEFER